MVRGQDRIAAHDGVDRGGDARRRAPGHARRSPTGELAERAALGRRARLISSSVAEGDTIHRTARALQKALGGKAIVGVSVPNPRSPLRRQPGFVDRLTGSAMTRAEARGKHLLLHFESDLVLHSHLGMRGSWRVLPAADDALHDRRAWVVIAAEDVAAIELDGPRLDLRTEAEVRADPRLRRLGPDVLLPEFDAQTGVAALRAADQSRRVGEVLLDQNVLAGIGNIYRCEGCWSARIDPWRPLGELTDDEVRRLVIETAALMRYGLETGRPPRSIYRRAGQPCPRCGTRIQSRGQGDGNRITYWCQSCQPSTRDNSRVGEDQ
jgi:endonuclease VIII